MEIYPQNIDGVTFRVEVELCDVYVGRPTIFSCNQLMLFWGSQRLLLSLCGWGGGVCKVIFVSNPTTVLRLSYVVYIVSFLCEISRHPPHWAVGYGYVILKTQNTKLRKKVLKKEFIWLLKAPVIKQNFFKDFYVRLQGFSNKLENCQNLSRIRLVPLSGI